EGQLLGAMPIFSLVAALGMLAGCSGGLTSAVCACSESAAIANIAYRKPDENCISRILLRIRREMTVASLATAVGTAAPGRNSVIRAGTGFHDLSKSH